MEVILVLCHLDFHQACLNGRVGGIQSYCKLDRSGVQQPRKK